MDGWGQWGQWQQENGPAVEGSCAVGALLPGGGCSTSGCSQQCQPSPPHRPPLLPLVLLPQLEELELALNEITPEGAVAVGALLAAKPRLRRVNLRENELEDEGALAIARGIAGWGVRGGMVHRRWGDGGGWMNSARPRLGGRPCRGGVFICLMPYGGELLLTGALTGECLAGILVGSHEPHPTPHPTHPPQA